ncbi:hypothetical protein BaRGS_00020084 [Batillaria attramentaria]|uniref:Uncharacterized protein n=1 Tax=Batillaria attramentaria TaxID=370345 RepID=A0ABD0KNY1_9CAEN
MMDEKKVAVVAKSVTAHVNKMLFTVPPTALRQCAVRNARSCPASAAMYVNSKNCQPTTTRRLRESERSANKDVRGFLTSGGRSADDLSASGPQGSGQGPGAASGKGATGEEGRISLAEGFGGCLNSVPLGLSTGDQLETYPLFVWCSWLAADFTLAPQSDRPPVEEGTALATGVSIEGEFALPNYSFAANVLVDTALRRHVQREESETEREGQGKGRLSFWATRESQPQSLPPAGKQGEEKSVHAKKATTKRRTSPRD